jgi:hypothetical protein
MKTVRTLSVFGFLALALSSPALAADITGTWVGNLTRPNGTTVPFIPVLKQDGEKVTGTLTGNPPDVQISNGMVKGDTVTFSSVRQVNGQDVKFNYTGKIAGEKIDITIDRGDGQAPMHVTVERKK